MFGEDNREESIFPLNDAVIIPAFKLLDGSTIENTSYADLIARGVSKTESRKAELDTAKASALSRIEVKADEYQNLFLGVNSSERQARFERNLVMAKAIIADNANTQQIEALTKQCIAKVVEAELAELPADDATNEDINLIAAEFKHSNEAGEFSGVLAFAHWINDWEPLTDLVSGEIEAFLVNARTALNKITDVEQIEPFIEAISTQAEQRFIQLTGG